MAVEWSRRMALWRGAIACGALASGGLRNSRRARGADETPAPADAVEPGFVPLFDGRTLDGWMGAVEGYEVRDGALVCVQQKGGNLFTVREYANFIVRFDVRIPPGGNNGLGVRCPPLQSSVVTDGIEIQILDDCAEQYRTLKPYQYHGSVYGVAPAQRGHLKPPGEWNAQEVTVDGRRIRVVLNGATIVDVDLDEAARGGTIDGREHPGLKRARGHLGLIGHGSEVAFRRLRIKELP